MNPARAAGFAYLAVVLTGLFALAGVPAALSLVADNHENMLLIARNPMLYRLGLLGLVANQVAFILLPLLLWRLLHAHGHLLAALMVAFALVGVPLALSAVALRLDALATDGTAAVAMLDAARNRMLMAMLFWGLWLLPLGLLVWRARSAPRLLALLLMLGCLGYVAQVVIEMLALHPAGLLESLIRLPAPLGEIGLALWLSLFGGRHMAK